MSRVTDNGTIWERDSDYDRWLEERSDRDMALAHEQAEELDRAERLDALAPSVREAAERAIRDWNPAHYRFPTRWWSPKWRIAYRVCARELCATPADRIGVLKRIRMMDKLAEALQPNPFDEHEALVTRGRAVLAKGVPLVTRTVARVDLSKYPASA